MRNGKTPEYVFLAAFLQLQVAQEYLALLRSLRGPYAAAVRRQFAAVLSALYGSAGYCGESGCMEALQDRCREHPAFSAGDRTRILSQIDDLRRRYASLSLRTAPPAAASISEAEQFIADTECTLRDIGSLLAAAAGQAGGEYFMEQYERLRKSR